MHHLRLAHVSRRSEVLEGPQELQVRVLAREEVDWPFWRYYFFVHIQLEAPPLWPHLSQRQQMLYLQRLLLLLSELLHLWRQEPSNHY
jgi:hypothetical protein